MSGLFGGRHPPGTGSNRRNPSGTNNNSSGTNYNPYSFQSSNNNGFKFPSNNNSQPSNNNNNNNYFNLDEFYDPSMDFNKNMVNTKTMSQNGNQLQATLTEPNQNALQVIEHNSDNNKVVALAHIQANTKHDEDILKDNQNNRQFQLAQTANNNYPQNLQAYTNHQNAMHKNEMEKYKKRSTTIASLDNSAYLESVHNYFKQMCLNQGIELDNPHLMLTSGHTGLFTEPELNAHCYKRSMIFYGVASYDHEDSKVTIYYIDGHRPDVIKLGKGYYPSFSKCRNYKDILLVRFGIDPLVKKPGKIEICSEWKCSDLIPCDIPCNIV